MTAYAPIDIWNQAIRHLGDANEVQDVTENSQEANVCRRFFSVAQDDCLRDFPWPFATITAPLALVASFVPSTTVPTTLVPEWWYAYAYPADCLRLHQILLPVPARATPYIPWRIPYVVRANPVGNGQLIYTNLGNAVIEYTQTQITPANWPTDFVDAVALRLAVYAAPSLAAGDPYRLADRCQALYMDRIQQAQANAMNEQQALPNPESSFVDTRMAGGPWIDSWGGWPIGPFPG